MRVLDDWLLTPQRAAVHMPTATAVVADLHLGYDRVRRRGGEAVPARSVAAICAPLLQLVREQGVRRLLIAGDLFEDGRCQRDELTGEFRSWVEMAGLDLVGVVPGNHDRGLGEGQLPVYREGMTLGDWHIVHGDGGEPGPVRAGSSGEPGPVRAGSSGEPGPVRAGSSGESGPVRAGSSGEPGPVRAGRRRIVQGHEHPWLRWQIGVEGPCFLVAVDHLVLPAYSGDAAGGNVLGQSRWASYRCCVIAGEAVLDFGELGRLRQRLSQ